MKKCNTSMNIRLALGLRFRVRVRLKVRVRLRDRVRVRVGFRILRHNDLLKLLLKKGGRPDADVFLHT